MADPDSPFASRIAILRDGLDVPKNSGIEIGPLANPVVAKSEGAITYIDYTDAASLRKTYGKDPGVDVAKIVEIDAIWGDQKLADCVDGRFFDYVLASHVAEHVPDLIAWLGEVRSVLKPGGQLRLVLPDHRFSFDVLRDETRLLDVLTNWVLRARRPQVHNVLDFRLHYAPGMDGYGRYLGNFDVANAAPAHEFELAIKSAGWARDAPQEYLDVHCWVFTPRSFARLMAQLADRGLLQLACAGFVDTAPPLFEFYVFLKPCDDAAMAAESWRAAVADLRDPLPGSAEEGQRAAEADQARRVVQELAEARHEVALLKNSSSWRMTAPLRWVRGKSGI